jgi:polysaccharide chain length determinant protein (PEP-CTERM system associated)
MKISPDRLVRAIINEGFQYRRALITIFVAVNLVMLLIALTMAKNYTAAAIILVDEKNIIQPLMEGAAVTTEVSDRSKMVKQIVHGRKLMTEIMEYIGWLRSNPTPEDQDRLHKKLIRQTQITNIGNNLIKIEYQDENPERAQLTAQKMAELFIDQSLEAKVEESQSAYEFIDKQTKQYHEKLALAENELKEFRSANLDAGPGAETGVTSRLNVLQERIEQAQLELTEAINKKASIERELSGEAEVASAVSREGQFRTRIGELQSQLDTLRLSYHDSYPDIVRLRHQITDLNEAIAAEKTKREQAKAAGRTVVDEGVVNNPLYQQLRGELSTTNITIDTLKARIAESKRKIREEIDRGKRVHGGEATLAELTRDYEVNREIYQDLLRRREQARVSMNIDKDKQGLSFKIYEQATIPLLPSGPRYIHIVILGLILSLALPVGAIYALLRFDPRIRFSDMIVTSLKLPVVASVPHLWTPSETAVANDESRKLILIIAATMVIIVTISLMRFGHLI